MNVTPRIRVLVVLSGLSAGGAETMYMNLYRKLDKSKYEIDFLIFGDKNGFYADEIKNSGGKIFKMSSIRETGIIGFYTSLKNFFLENGPYDVVHSHIDYLSGFVLREAKKRNVKIRLSHSHNTSAYTNSGSISVFYMLLIRRLINNNATKRLACSTESAEFMFGRKKVQETTIIHNAIDLERFRDVGQYNVFNDVKFNDKQIILHIGRFVEQKNHKELITIFKKYNEKNKDAVLVLVGEGELKEEIVQLVKSCGLQEFVSFLGVRSDIPELLAVSDVFVLPSKFEGLPVTLIEAQAMNVPCVVSNNIKKDVDCEMGLMSFVPLGDYDAWIEVIDKAIKERKRVDNYFKMTNQGYNIDNNVHIIEALYKESSDNF